MALLWMVVGESDGEARWLPRPYEPEP
jgi:hypothetical protein